MNQKNPALFGFFCVLGIQFCCLLLLQWIVRAIFIMQRGHYRAMSGEEVLSSYAAGLGMDLSFCCYIFSLFLLLYWLLYSGRSYAYRKWSIIILGVFSFVQCCLAVIDSELFVAWGSRINQEVFRFMRTPKEAMASTANAYWIRGIFFMLAGTFIILTVYRKWLPLTRNFVPKKKWEPAIILSWIGLLFLTIIGARGGLQTIPIMQSSVYFSQNRTANATALNSGWNFVYYAARKTPVVDLRAYDNGISGIADSLAAVYTSSNINTESISKIKDPNVVIILLESFNAYLSKRFGGKYDHTPFLDSLAGQGWWFSHMYAASNRTDKAMAVMNSAWPGQPWESILNLPAKAAKLPSLPGKFKAAGYGTEFFYGGDPDFANMGAYLHAMGYDRIFDKEHYQSVNISKWGHHDEYLFKKVMEVSNSSKQPFFQFILTLSSHEPFDVPWNKVQSGGAYQPLFNAVNYTDHCLRQYFAHAQKQPWYNRTLFVLVADHGREIGLDAQQPSDRIRYRIPAIIMGPALKDKYRGVEDKRVVSQLDLPQTLISGILGGERTFPYSRNLADTKLNPGAFFFVNGGFGMMNGQDEIYSWENSIKGSGSQTVNNERTKKNGEMGRALQYVILRQYSKL